MDTIFSWMIIFVFIAVMAKIFFKFRKKRAHFSVPNMLTSIGILGTFGGICISLFCFNVDNIDQSIPGLLGGLKIAFLTSIIGIASSLWYKWRHYPKVKDDNLTEGATIDDIIKGQNKLIELQTEFNTKSLSQFSNIEKALIGEGDSTLLTQMQKLRTTFSDKQDELVTEFKAFATNMEENNINALTDAIQNLVTDFNKKITDEFGENFKQLNLAVEKMVTWQDNYKNQVEAMIIQLEQSTQSIKETEQSVSLISTHSATITTMAENLNTSLKILTTELSAFAEMGDKAKQAFPHINTELDKLTKGLHYTIENITQENKKMIDFNQESLRTQSKTLTDHHTMVIEQINKSIENTNSQLETFVIENSKNIAKQITELDKALGEELEKSLQMMGSQLTSLSSKFVEDYTPLTTKLKEVVEMANKIPV